MFTIIPSKILAIANTGIVVYFILLYLLYRFGINYILIGVFVELLTIPMLLAQIGFIPLSSLYLVKNKKDPLLITSLLLLTICSIVTLGSFI